MADQMARTCDNCGYARVRDDGSCSWCGWVPRSDDPCVHCARYLVTNGLCTWCGGKAPTCCGRLDPHACGIQTGRCCYSNGDVCPDHH